MTVAFQPISIIIGIYREETLMTSKMEILPDDGTAVLFTVSETQVEVFEKLQDAEVNGGFF